MDAVGVKGLSCVEPTSSNRACKRTLWSLEKLVWQRTEVRILDGSLQYHMQHYMSGWTVVFCASGGHEACVPYPLLLERLARYIERAKARV